jgi:hypothetical protein
VCCQSMRRGIREGASIEGEVATAPSNLGGKSWREIARDRRGLVRGEFNKLSSLCVTPVGVVSRLLFHRSVTGSSGWLLGVEGARILPPASSGGT